MAGEERHNRAGMFHRAGNSGSPHRITTGLTHGGFSADLFLHISTFEGIFRPGVRRFSIANSFTRLVRGITLPWSTTALNSAAM
jgi:hypothetical protein